MGIGLNQIAQATESNLRAGVIEHIIDTFPFLNLLTFVEAPSMRYEWSARKRLIQAGFRGLNDNYTPGQSEYDRAQIDLKPLGGEFRIDRLLADIPDINRDAFIQTELRGLSIATAMAFKKFMIKGNRAADMRQFDGLERWATEGLIPTTDLAAAGTDFHTLGGKATMKKLDEWLNSLIVRPDVILANRTQISDLNTLAVATAANNAFATVFQTGTVTLPNGRQILTGSYRGIPMLAVDTDGEGNEILAFNEPSPDGSASNCSSMYALVLGDNYTTGIQQTNAGPRVFRYTTDAGHVAVAVDWPTAIAVEHPRGAARLRGIKAAA
jgi:hypothetical protein